MFRHSSKEEESIFETTDSQACRCFCRQVFLPSFIEHLQKSFIHFPSREENFYLRMLNDWLMMSAEKWRANWILMEWNWEGCIGSLLTNIAAAVLDVVFMALINSMWTQSTVSTIETFRRFVSRWKLFHFSSFSAPNQRLNGGRKSQTKKMFEHKNVRSVFICFIK